MLFVHDEYGWRVNRGVWASVGSEGTGSAFSDLIPGLEWVTSSYPQLLAPQNECGANPQATTSQIICKMCKTVS